ncbi:MAG: hypothetical protein C0608_10995 [Deltaproteobacteria bacterium]|nr:MAG: hypothetical protein C0608_10995 [Deltaproteobacteria bacterium]
MRAKFTPKGIATGIGSLPHLDPDEAVGLVMESLPAFPFWPQLPKLSHLEGMTLQYAPGLPGLLCEGESCHIDTGDRGVGELDAFYGRVLEGDTASFALQYERAQGFKPFLEALGGREKGSVRFVKGHVTGPVTLASALKDSAGREIVTDESFREAVSAQLAMNARWQIRELGRFGAPVIIFLDEPVMEVFGSAYSTLDRETVIALWSPVLDAIREEGGISGIHCCGNTDWGFLFESGTDIVNFDAYNFMEKMTLYSGEAEKFIENGGALAWGIVPTSDEVRGETLESLSARLDEGIKAFEAAGVAPELLRRQCLLTPSCGMGSLTVEETKMVFDRLGELSLKYMRLWENL